MSLLQLHPWAARPPKVEDIEGAISKLGLFEQHACSAFETSAFESSGGQRPVVRRAPFFSPGLQRAFAGKVWVGFLPGKEMVPAKSIEASRLEFRGEPVFDPTPFLDPLGQKIFNHPLQMAMDPRELSESVPPVRVFASETEKWALLRKLDQNRSARCSEIFRGPAWISGRPLLCA